MTHQQTTDRISHDRIISRVRDVGDTPDTIFVTLPTVSPGPMHGWLSERVTFSVFYGRSAHGGSAYGDPAATKVLRDLADSIRSWRLERFDFVIPDYVDSSLEQAEAQLRDVQALAQDVWGPALIGWETQKEECAELDGEHWVATGTVEADRERFRNGMRDFFERLSTQFEGRDLSRLVVDFRRKR